MKRQAGGYAVRHANSPLAQGRNSNRGQLAPRFAYYQNERSCSAWRAGRSDETIKRKDTRPRLLFRPTRAQTRSPLICHAVAISISGNGLGGQNWSAPPGAFGELGKPLLGHCIHARGHRFGGHVCYPWICIVQCYQGGVRSTRRLCFQNYSHARIQEQLCPAVLNAKARYFQSSVAHPRLKCNRSGDTSRCSRQRSVCGLRVPPKLP